MSMKLKKKIAIAMAMVAVCSSIAVPVVANAGETETRTVDCIHDWRQNGSAVYNVKNTYHHGHLVGDLLDNNYVDCTVTIIEISREFTCGICGTSSVETETTDIHSVN